MKGKRLADVLDDDYQDKTFTGRVLEKMLDLLKLMESKNPNIDDFEYRWVESIIDKIGDNYKPTKNDLLKANVYWKKWNLIKGEK